MTPPLLPSTVASILIVRPDTYGDLILNTTLLRSLRAAYPQARLGLVLQAAYADLGPLLPEGVELLSAPFNPYRGVLPVGAPELVTLAAAIQAFAPEVLLAPCFERTWFERWVAAQLPAARRVGVAGPAMDPLIHLDAQAKGHAVWDDVVQYPELLTVEEASPEVEKLSSIAQQLAGQGGELPELRIPEALREQAAEVLAELRLEPGGFLACCPAGVANVVLKVWPAEPYAECVAEIETSWKVPVLLVGHESESERVGRVASLAEARGATPRQWLGRSGEFGLLTALLAASRGYFGNDTGPMHAAAATGVPVVSVFGGGAWPRFAPRGKGAIVTVIQPLACFGCGWHCHFGDAPCLRTIPPRVALEALRAALEAAPGTDRWREVDAWEGLGAEARGLIERVMSARGHGSLAAAREQARDCARRLQESELGRGQLGRRVSELEQMHHARCEEVAEARSELARRPALAGEPESLGQVLGRWWRSRSKR